MAVDEADQGDGRLADLLGQGRDFVEGCLGQAVKKAKPVQEGQASLLVLWI